MLTPIAKTKADIGELRELLGLSQLDMFFLIGIMPAYSKMQKDDSSLNLRMSNLIRLLNKKPNLQNRILPYLHSIEETYRIIESVWDVKELGKFSHRKFAHLIGVTSQTEQKWMTNQLIPSASTFRLCHLIYELIQEQDLAGFKVYLECANDSAIADGIVGGLRELLAKGPKTKKQRASATPASIELE